MGKKRFFYLFSITCILLLFTVTFASASSTGGACGKDVRWQYDSRTKTVTISGTGEVDNYDRFGNEDERPPWSTPDYDVEHMVVKNGVKKLGVDMFPWGLKTISIPASVKEFPVTCMQHCPNLERMTIDSRNAYYSCDNICVYSKDKSKLLTYLDIGKKKTVTIPEGVKVVCEGAFCEFDSFEKIVFPHSLTELETNAFAMCGCLQELSFGAGFKKWNRDAFAACDGLSRYTVRGNNPVFRSDANGILLTRDGTTVIACPPRARIQDLVLPEGVTTIDAYAFFDNQYLQSVSFPKSLTTMKKGAFNSCVKLKTVEIPETVTTLKSSVFSGCTALRSASVKRKVSVIPAALFAGCSSLRRVELPDSVTTIGAKAFLCCEKLKGFSLPPQLISIGKDAFASALHEKSLFIPASVTTIGLRAFQRSTVQAFQVDSENPSFQSDARGCLLSKDGTTMISYPAAAKAETYTVPDTVTKIGAHAFDTASVLEVVKLPQGLKRIGAYAFCDCGIRTVKLPQSVEKIGHHAFFDCRFTTAVLPEGLTKIPEMCFASSAITTLRLPKSVRFVGAAAFFNCDALKKLVVRNPYCTFADAADEYGDVFFPIQAALFAPLDSAARAMANSWRMRFVPICDNGHVMQKKVTPADLHAEGTIRYACPRCNQYAAESIAAVQSVKLSKTTLRYTGKTRKPSVTVLNETGARLQKGTDYKLKWLTDCKTKGVQKVKVVLIGNYNGSITKKFVIK